ncbi:MAG: AzlC family ABC transporter permease [Lachnospiraceae bacterium]|nr:AzlC family ABC transporter permease [Lachnospiraceae bacterium]
MNKQHMNSDFSTNFRKGIQHGIPICLGYFFVSFGVGIMASRSGISPWVAALISLTNLTSAGEAAGIGVIAAGGSYIEMVMTQILINLRYSLMGLSLSQNLDESFRPIHRLTVSYGITDEIFGVASGQKEPLKPAYMYGMIFIATVGWTLGTLMGGICGDILPVILTNALGVMLYGMFIAIIIPPIRESLSNLAVILLAAGASCLIYFCLPKISSGFAIIISAIFASVIMAILHPISDEEEQEKQVKNQPEETKKLTHEEGMKSAPEGAIKPAPEEAKKLVSSEAMKPAPVEEEEEA